MRYAYDPYGAPDGQATLDATAQANPFRFEGHYTDGPTGAIDAQARTYLPDPGLFASPDRLEDAGADQALLGRPGTQSRYALAGGSPVGNPDWDGHDPLTDGGNTTTGRGGPGTMSRPANREARRTTAAARTDTARRIRSNASPDRASPPAPNQAIPNARTRPAPTPAAAPAPEQDDSSWFGSVTDAAASAGRAAERANDWTIGTTESFAPGLQSVNQFFDRKGLNPGYTANSPVMNAAREQADAAQRTPQFQIAVIGASIFFPEGAAAAAGTAGATRGALLIRSLFAGRTATTAAETGAAATEARAILGAAKAPKTVTMGRDMRRRVIPYADRNGYGYYGGTPSWIPFRSERLDLFFNKRWIKKQMRRDNEIVDIGEPAGMPPSRFYDMERRATSGYPKYREDPQP